MVINILFVCCCDIFVITIDFGLSNKQKTYILLKKIYYKHQYEASYLLIIVAIENI